MIQVDAGPWPARLSDTEFARFQRLIYDETGIYLGPTKRELLYGRLIRRLRELGDLSFTAYFERVTGPGGAAERVRLLDAITTNETRFFREPQHFTLLDRLLPRWVAEAAAGRRPRRLRVWSAGCSTGEEPYSVAMTLLEHCRPVEEWDLEILATDLSTRALERARHAVWPLARSTEIPPHLLKRYMLRGRGPQEGVMRASSELRRLVRVERLNLNDADYPSVGVVDLLFCRNVLIYFDAASKRRVITRLVAHLRPGGLLFLGHSESLAGLHTALRPVIPTVYERPAEAQRGAADAG